MPAALKLISHKLCPFVQRAVIALTEKGTPFERIDIDLAEVSITSAATLVEGEGPPDAFRLDGVADVAVEVRLAQGKKCARSWKILENVGSDPAYPDVSARDAQALREWEIMRRAAE